MQPPVCPTTRSLHAWTPDVKWYPCDANASLAIASVGWKSMLVRVVPGLFLPELVVPVLTDRLIIPPAASSGSSTTAPNTVGLEPHSVCAIAIVASLSCLLQFIPDR